MKVLGEGYFNWLAYERRSDRYGSVLIGDQNGPEVEFDKSDDGKKGELWAEVVGTRTCVHMGDLARGIFHSPPSVGERIKLGEGTLFFEDTEDGCHAVGLKPDDGRKTDWLDPQMMHRCCQQDVRLEFHPMSSGCYCTNLDCLAHIPGGHFNDDGLCETCLKAAH